MTRRVSRLSGGTRRKVSLAMALLGEPRIVWLDEPTTGMDPLARRATWQVIGQLRSAQRTFVLTSHNLEEADALCSRIGVMVDGRLRAVGSPADLKRVHGRGHRVDVTAAIDDIESVDAHLMDTFADCVRLNDFGATRHYQVRGVPPGTIFAAIERERERLRVSDYAVSECTLEQVFLQLVAQVEAEH